MIAARLTMRAQVERNQAVATDTWGQPVAADFQPIGAPLACFAWSPNASVLIDGSKTAQIEGVRAMFALGADVAENDQLVAITDRQGAVLFPGRLKVEGPVQFKHNHLEADLVRIG
ncbi:MAG: hypothetical protein P0Y59_02585 [Candidatus Sphingomonas phytovorans]|nr:hypothetical protein [Sphingomonas sp.]WEK00598.1 MAG: hypothetical protein P0Y59_02585 [Sphingomonas sp.]